jgi:EAL domain-containing protein (putative c-di-GMP-specific phosphodiesterase class I)
MYASKRGHLGTVVYHESLDPYRADRLGLASELRSALAGGQLTVHYQPIVDTRTRAWVGVEALIRWPGRGIEPSLIIEVAEAAGLMRQLTEFVLSRALSQVRSWDVWVSVNLSAMNLLEADLAERVASVLTAVGVDGSRLHLEVTETAVIGDRERAAAQLNALRDLGVSLSIDDYGTGNAGVGYVRHLPVHALKIDRSFIAGMFTDAADEAIVRTTIDLAQSLGLVVIAEGVETERDVDALAALGCDFLQGYHFSRPKPAEELARHLLLGPHQARWSPPSLGSASTITTKALELSQPHAQASPASS